MKLFKTAFLFFLFFLPPRILWMFFRTLVSKAVCKSPGQHIGLHSHFIARGMGLNVIICQCRTMTFSN